MNQITIDTIDFFVATRINGASASIACNNPIDIQLLKLLDDKIRPNVQENIILKKYIKGIWNYEGTDYTSVIELTKEEIECIEKI